MKILKLLDGRTSKNPLVSSAIEHAMSISGAQVRDIVRELRREGHLIGSVSDRGKSKGGYYIISTLGEYEETRQHIENRLISLTNTLKKMDASADKRFGQHDSGQMRFA